MPESWTREHASTQENAVRPPSIPVFCSQDGRCPAERTPNAWAGAGRIRGDSSRGLRWTGSCGISPMDGHLPIDVLTSRGGRQAQDRPISALRQTTADRRRPHALPGRSDPVSQLRAYVRYCLRDEAGSTPPLRVEEPHRSGRWIWPRQLLFPTQSSPKEVTPSQVETEEASRDRDSLTEHTKTLADRIARIKRGK